MTTKHTVNSFFSTAVSVEMRESWREDFWDFCKALEEGCLAGAGGGFALVVEGEVGLGIGGIAFAGGGGIALGVGAALGELVGEGCGTFDKANAFTVLVGGEKTGCLLLSGCQRVDLLPVDFKTTP